MDNVTRETLKLDDAQFERALAAINRYRRRQARAEHPEGEFDSGGRWYPSARESHGVMHRIRPPSLTHPNSLMLACRSLGHCEAIEGADHRITLLVQRWIKHLESTHVGEQVDPRVYREAAKLELATHVSEAGTVRASRRARL